LHMKASDSCKIQVIIETIGPGCPAAAEPRLSFAAAIYQKSVKYQYNTRSLDKIQALPYGTLTLFANKIPTIINAGAMLL